MTMQRTCYFCGKPVSFRRRMALFCSERCEHVHRSLTGEAPHAPAAPPGSPSRAPAGRSHRSDPDRLPPPPAPTGRPRGLFRA